MLNSRKITANPVVIAFHWRQFHKKNATRTMLRYQICETKTFSWKNASETRTNLTRFHDRRKTSTGLKDHKSSHSLMSNAKGATTLKYIVPGDARYKNASIWTSPESRALAYIYRQLTRDPRLRRDSKSINPRNYFRRSGGGGGGGGGGGESRVIDAYSYELA